MVELWSPAHKIVLERRLWIAVLRGPARPRRRRPRRRRSRPTSGRRPGRPRLDRRPRAGHPPRREGPHRGVLRPRRPRAHPQGHDLARPHRERRAAPGPRRARAGPRPHGRRPGPAGRARRRARRHWSSPAAATTSPAQATTLGKRFANAGEELLAAFAPGRRPARPLPAAGHQGPGRHPAGPARPARRRRRAGRPSSSSAVAAHLGLRRARSTNVGQVYPRSLDLDVVSALVQAASGPSSLATTHPPHGRPGAGHRGLQAGPGRLLGHAAQDEHPVVRAGQRLPRHPRAATSRWSPALAGDQWNEGDVSLLGRPPGGAARRVLRHRRPVRDVPHRARRVRRLPGGDRARAAPLPAVPRHHQGADGRGARPASAARWPTRPSRSTPSPSPSPLRAGPRRATTCSTGSAADPPPRRSTADELAGAARRARSTFAGAAPSQVAAFVAQVERARRAAIPDAGGLPPRRHPLTAADRRRARRRAGARA